MPTNEDFMPHSEEIEDSSEQVNQNEDDMYSHVKFVVDKGQTQVRIDKFLTDKLPKISRNKVQNAIRVGSVLVDNQVVAPNFKIKPNQTISIVFPDSHDDGVVAADNVPLDIVYEDDDILLINKPAGLVCHPGVGNLRNTLINGIAYYWQQKGKDFATLNPEERPGLVHRIDKDTSGLLIIAKHQHALNHLARQFFYHTIERRYWALVWSQPDPLQGTINVNIGRSPHDPTIIQPFLEAEAGKHAITHYKVIEPMYYVSLVECRLETGRTHQIRVHMKHLGHPLFMDERYGGNLILKGTIFTKYKQFVLKTMDAIQRQSLHAKSLGFEHPRTGKWMHFESELPEDFQKGLDLWRDYVNERKSLL